MVEIGQSMSAISQKIIPIAEIILIAVFIIIILGALFYYFVIVARRKKWVCRIWEMKANGKLHLIGEDILIRKMLDFGKRQLYQFKKTKYYCSNPPLADEVVQRVGNKEFVDYLRIGIAYYPLQQETKNLSSTINEKKKEYVGLIKSLSSKIEFWKHKETKTDTIWIPMFVPFHRTLVINNTYTAMSYDLDMMRMASIDTREQMYKQTQTFWDKYKEPIVWALLVMSVIIIGYLSFEYMKNVMAQNISLCANAIDKCIANVTKVVPPPS